MKLSFSLAPVFFRVAKLPSGRSWPRKKTAKAEKVCIKPGMKNAIRQAVNLTAPVVQMRSKTRGMMSWVAPPPKLPHPPATPLAVPTTGEENIELIQNWVETNVAKEKPAERRNYFTTSNFVQTCVAKNARGTCDPTHHIVLGIFAYGFMTSDRFGHICIRIYEHRCISVCVSGVVAYVVAGTNFIIFFFFFRLELAL